MRAGAARVLALRLVTVLAAGACNPTVIIGVLGARPEGGVEGGGAQADATVDAEGDGLADVQGDAQGDAQGCPGSGTDAAPTPDPDASVGAWTTGFEDGFCDYTLPTGYCYAAGGSYSLVTSPVHSGRYAAAFTAVAVGDASAGPVQARCVQQGVFPSAAYYGAWYYVPAEAVKDGGYNLFHFQGVGPGTAGSNLWDVSLVNTGAAAPLHVLLYDFLNNMTPSANAVPPIPIGQYFHIEVYFKRAKDTTGTLTLFQDGVMAVSLTGLVTDPTDWGQWYVGIWANSLTPPGSTIYVDDVSVGFTQ